MKKILYSTLIAIAGLFAFSCEQDHIDVVYDPNSTTPQTLGAVAGCELTEESASELVTIPYNDVNFGMEVAKVYGFNVASMSDMSDAVKLTATIADGNVTFTKKALNTALLNFGAEAGQEFTAYFQLCSYIANDKNTGIESTLVASDVVSAVFIPYESILLDKDKFAVAYLPGGYQAKGDGGSGWVFTDEQYLYEYNKDGVYTGLVDFYEVGAAGLDYGFKLTLSDTWDNGDFGVEKGAVIESEPDMLDLKDKPTHPENDNILCFDTHRYYMFKFTPSANTLQKMYAFDNVGIVGSFNGWAADDATCKMTYNKYYHRFYIDWTFDTDAELKFTCDDAWEQNWGVDCVPGGDNIPVKAGSYRIYLDLNKKEYDFSTAMFGKEEPGAQEKPDDPDTYSYTGWGIIGDFNEWAVDAAMYETDGVWTGYVTLEEGQGLKIRKDGGWEENFGGTFVALGEPIVVVAGGDNITPGAGFYQVVYDSNAGTITINVGDVWGVIGDFNSWAADVYMTSVEGVWTSYLVEFKEAGGFKIRHNCDWEENFGGTFVALGEPFTAVPGGDNIALEPGKYSVVYDSNAGTITVNSYVPAQCWGVIGDFNGWGGDEPMTEVAPGIWVSDMLTLTGGWKLRYNGGWDVNYGGNTPGQFGQFVQAVAGGSNIAIEGTFKVALNTNNGTIGTLEWGLVGSIASLGFGWNEDLPMSLGADGRWYSAPVVLTADDEFKIRQRAGWEVNVGGTCEAVEEAFAVVSEGANIKAPADGTYMVVYDPAASNVTLTTGFWGLIGAFNGWGGDVFMLPGGDGKWYAFNQHLEGEWKIRQSADWAVNRGGTYVWEEPFDVVADGPNIAVTDEGVPAAGFNVIYDTASEKVTINQNVIF